MNDLISNSLIQQSNVSNYHRYRKQKQIFSAVNNNNLLADNTTQGLNPNGGPYL